MPRIKISLQDETLDLINNCFSYLELSENINLIIKEHHKLALTSLVGCGLQKEDFYLLFDSMNGHMISSCFGISVDEAMMSIRYSLYDYLDYLSSGELSEDAINALDSNHHLVKSRKETWDRFLSLSDAAKQSLTYISSHWWSLKGVASSEFLLGLCLISENDNIKCMDFILNFYLENHESFTEYQAVTVSENDSIKIIDRLSAVIKNRAFAEIFFHSMVENDNGELFVVLGSSDNVMRSKIDNDFVFIPLDTCLDINKEKLLPIGGLRSIDDLFYVPKDVFSTLNQ